MNTLMTRLIVVVSVLLAGCTQGITMRHPDGRTAECGGMAFHGPALVMVAPIRERECINDFKEQGVVRQP